MGRLGFAILIVVMLAAGLAGLLVLNTTIQAQSMQIAQETRNLNVLQHQQAVLAAEVDHLRGPQNLQEQAKKLGMRPNPYGSYIDLRTGKVIGTQTKVDGKEVPGVIGETAKPEGGQP
ncbi:septum formation initiator family protein [Cutibacterium acnes]|uniref:septum formation initiator family protein n=1 Tax=Cutibacterium acnes TaxID=1747 RepID=UPI0001F0A5DA|nr:septum formation initiator family protein [Cutibacterium acnes]EFT34301.1 putative cell division protein FtsL [Cutibacterium acnes HL005PA3]